MYRSGRQRSFEDLLVVGARLDGEHGATLCVFRAGDTRQAVGPAGGGVGSVHDQTGSTLGAQVVDGTDDAHASMDDDADALAQSLYQIELVAREDHRDTGVRLLDENLAHDIDGDRIETRERFVENEDGGIVYERCGELNALLIAERQ